MSKNDRDGLDWLELGFPSLLPPASCRELDWRALAILFDRTQPKWIRWQAALILAQPPEPDATWKNAKAVHDRWAEYTNPFGSLPPLA